MKKILITGGLGFIGTNLIELLLNKKKFKILNLDRFSYCSNKQYKQNKKNYKYIKIDLAKNFLKIQSIIKNFNPNYIINLAANSHVDVSIKDPLNFIDNNNKITLNVLNSIIVNNKILKKVKLIHIGTDEIYGEIKNHEKKIFSENSKLSPNSPYSSSKAFSHHLVKSFSRTYGMKYNIINPSNNFGEYQYPEKLIPKTILSIINKKKVIIYKKGQNQRQWIYVKDTVKIICDIMIRGKVNQIYNIGFGKIFKNIDLVKIIHKYIVEITKKNFPLKIIFTKDRKGHDFKYNSSASKTRNLLNKNYNFKYSDLKRTINWHINKKNISQNLNI